MNDVYAFRIYNLLNIVMYKGNVILEQRCFRLTSVQLATRDDVNDCEKYVVWLMSAFDRCINPIMILLKFLEAKCYCMLHI